MGALPARGAGRRHWLARTAALVAGAALGGTGRRAASAGIGPTGATVSQAELLALLAERFPQRYPLAGLAELELRAPALALHPETNRLGARLAAALSSAALPAPREGALEVEFGLRYAAEDRSIRAHGIALRSLDIAGLDAATTTALQFWAPRLARRAWREVVLHRFEARELALLDGLGLQPGPITVTPQGLSVAWERKPTP